MAATIWAYLGGSYPAPSSTITTTQQLDRSTSAARTPPTCHDNPRLKVRRFLPSGRLGLTPRIVLPGFCASCRNRSRTQPPPAGSTIPGRKAAPRLVPSASAPNSAHRGLHRPASRGPHRAGNDDDHPEYAQKASGPRSAPSEPPSWESPPATPPPHAAEADHQNPNPEKA